MQLLTSTAFTALFIASIVGALHWTDTDQKAVVHNSLDRHNNGEENVGRMRGNLGKKCNTNTIIRKIFTCMDVNSDGIIHFPEAIVNRKCYKEYIGHDFLEGEDFYDFFTCIGNDAIHITFADALEKSCTCLGF